MRTTRLIEGALTRSIIGGFCEVYNTLDFGFPELVYKEALAKELRARGHRVDREVRVDCSYILVSKPSSTALSSSVLEKCGRATWIRISLISRI